MSSPGLEERVVALERQVAELQTNRTNGSASLGWRSTVGMFTGDDIMKQIDESARKLRAADRRLARRASTSKARKKNALAR